ncbi:MAG: Hsp20/alpha crystallin family protein [Spirochaetaceae bacterium]|nr:MAG: Hsp20/alpha crystallin family protein [Spirochaetaceae bacterium]
MNLVRWRTPGFDPGQELERIQDEINRLFDLDYGDRSTGLFDRATSPAIDVVEQNDHFNVYCDLPGVDQKDVDVSIAGNVLTIKGEKKMSSRGEKAKVFRKEEWAGSFQRTLSLPASVDPDKIQAEMTDGVLRVQLPKREEVKPRQITVNVS